MIRRLALLATAAAIVAIPQIAEAGCSGSGCASVSGTTVFSASDKRVRATVINKDQTSPIHVKFCVNVDYHCNGFDLTLSPHETITKDVSFTGSKPPQIHAVDVVTADFPAARASSPGGAPGSSPSSGSSASGSASNNSGASVAVDTPRGKLMVLASKQAAVTPNLTRAIEYYDKLGNYYATALDNSRTMRELVEKLGPIDNIKAEIAQTQDRQSKTESTIALGAELDLKFFNVVLDNIKSSAETARSNIEFSEGDLKAAKTMEQAQAVRQEANNMIGGLTGLLKLAGQAVDVAAATATGAGAITQVGSAINTMQRIVDFGGSLDKLVGDADKLEADAVKIGIANANGRITAFKRSAKDLKRNIAALEDLLPRYQQFVRKANTNAETNYDKLAKKGSRFNFDTLQKALTAARTSVETTRKTYEMAYGVRDQIKALSRAGDDSVWMAFPGEGRKTLNSMYETAGPAFDWAVKERPVAEATLKQLTEMYEAARTSMQ
jgi:hypothetical protein